MWIIPYFVGFFIGVIGMGIVAGGSKKGCLKENDRLKSLLRKVLEWHNEKNDIKYSSLNPALGVMNWIREFPEQEIQEALHDQE